MVSYILRRVLATMPVMAIVALLVFSLLYIAPGDPAAMIAGDQASPDDVERIRQSLGLDRPFLVQFGTWLWRILHGDLGTSIFTNLPVSSLIARITRASMLEVLQQDYIRTARAKGLGQRSILFVHALKNAAVPIVTVIGIGIALLIGGAVVTESVFAIPGLGRLTVDAILRRDYPVIQGIVLMFSFLYTLVNLMVDVTYTLVDPRIRY